MAGRKRHGLVVEEQKRVVRREPLLVPPAFELERARDPEVAGMKSCDLVAGVDAPAIAGPGASQLNRDNVTERSDTVSLRHAQRPVCAA